jgi:20S proteasome subunit beta 2
VCAAISAGIFNDLGSGSNVDAVIITGTHTETLRNVVKPNERVQKENNYKFRKGTTLFGKEEIRDLIVREEISEVARTAEAMDTS